MNVVMDDVEKPRGNITYGGGIGDPFVEGELPIGDSKPPKLDTRTPRKERQGSQKRRVTRKPANGWKEKKERRTYHATTK